MAIVNITDREMALQAEVDSLTAEVELLRIKTYAVQISEVAEERDAALHDARRMDYLENLLTHIHSGDGGYLNVLKFELFTSLVRPNLRTLVDAAMKAEHGTYTVTI